MYAIIIAEIILLVINLIFSGARAAILSVNDTWIENLSKEGDKRAQKLIRLRKHPSGCTAAAAIVSVFCICLGSALGVIYLEAPLMRLFGTLGGEGSNAGGFTLVGLLIVFFITLLHVVMGSLVPGKLAAVKDEETALSMAGTMDTICLVLTPLVWLLIVISNGILRLFHVDPSEQAEVTEEDIRQMVESGSQTGAIESQESELIQKVFEFNDISVDEICTHRKDAVCIYEEESLDEWDKVIYENRHSFYPVCGEDTDDIVGVLDARDYLRMKEYTREAVMKDCVHKPYFVPENMKAASLFRNMKKTGNYFAVAIDEYGGMAGIVTMRDLLELLVGEWKEKDEEPEPEDIVRTGDNSWKIRGCASLDEAAEALEIDLPVDEYDTFGGYILGELGYVPDDGTTLELETAELLITVDLVRDHRIEETVVVKKQSESDEKTEE